MSSSQLEDLLDRLGSLISAITPPVGLRLAEAFRSLALTFFRAISNALGSYRSCGKTASLMGGLRDALDGLGATPDVTRNQIEDLRSRYSRVRQHVGIAPFAWANPSWRRMPGDGVVIQFPQKEDP